MKITKQKFLELPPMEVQISFVPEGPYCCDALAEKEYVPQSWQFCPYCGGPLQIEEIRPEVRGDHGNLIFLREFFEREGKQ